MDRRQALTRDLIAEAIRSVVDDVAREHFDAVTQEHQLTSRICGALEARINDTVYMGQRVRIVLQEFPDKGRGSAEKKTGVDLYIGIEIGGASLVSKGMLIQSKWKQQHRNGSEQRRLVVQCRDMLARSPASYVWLYGAEGVEVVPAGEVIDAATTPPEELGTRKVSEVFRNVLDCFEGDRAIGLPASSKAGMRQALKSMIAEMSASQGLFVSVRPLPTEDDLVELVDWNPEA